MKLQGLFPLVLDENPKIKEKLLKQTEKYFLAGLSKFLELEKQNKNIG